MIVVILGLLGLVLGSFANAFVWRLHEGKDWVKDRSECVHCHHKLSANDLIPVLSWLRLGGKCRYCKKSISWQYPVVELSTAALFVGSYLIWPESFSSAGMVSFMFWLVFIVGFVVLAVYDLRWMELPDKVVYVLTGLAVVQALVLSAIERDSQDLLGALGGFAVVGGLFYVLFQISSGKWIGGGDVKLGFALGILAGGIPAGLLLLFTASFGGLLLSLPLLAIGRVKRTSHIPFGPFLLAAAVIVQLFGTSIIHWYQHLILL